MEPKIEGDTNSIGSFVKMPKYFLWAKLPPGAGTTKDRILTCLVLHSFGYRGELAVRLKLGKLAALSANDIRKELNHIAEECALRAGFQEPQMKDRILTRHDVRRALAALEDGGFVVRAFANGRLLRDLSESEKRRLHEHDVLIFCPFQPFAFRGKEVGKSAYLEPVMLGAAWSREDHQNLELVANKHPETDGLVGKIRPYIEKKDKQKKTPERKEWSAYANNMQAEESPALFDDLLELARAAPMDFCEGQMTAVRQAFKRFSLDERKAAIEGISVRISNGQYDNPRYIPGLQRYLVERLWTARLRPRSQAEARLSYLDSIIAGEGDNNGNN